MSFALSSRLQQLSLLVKQRPLALEKPIVIQFPVIDICNSQCQMCRIWENKKSEDITPDQLRIGLRNPLYSEVATVGLNGGEPTLRKDLAALVQVLFDELPKLKSIALITNAYRYREVIQRIGEVGSIAHRYGARLDVMVSLDGFGEMHDRVRGKPGNFARAQHVIDFCKHSPEVDALRIGCTIIKENVYGLADLFDYCHEQNLYVKYRLGIPHKRLYTENLRDPYALTNFERFHIAEFLHGLIEHYEPGDAQKFFYRSLIGQLVNGASRRAGCDWQHRGATITAHGELLYCAVQSKTLGTIHKDDSQAVFFSEQPHLQDIITNKCDDCAHDYVGIPPRDELARRAAGKALAKFKSLGIPGTSKALSLAKSMVARRRYDRRISQLTGIRKSDSPAYNLHRDVGEAKRYLICGWYGTETLGDKAILAGLIRALRRKLGSVQFAVVSLYPYISQITRDQMEELTGSEIVTVEQALTNIDHFAGLFFGGGPLMAIDEIADMRVLFERAVASGVPTATLGCGLGPFGGTYRNRDIARLLNQASLRIYRDPRSKESAHEIGVVVSDATDHVAEDPAFTWLAAIREQVQPAERPVGRQLILGLRDFPAQQYGAHLSGKVVADANRRFEGAILDALERLLATHNDLTVVPLPMCTNHFGSDDRWYYRRLLRQRPHLRSRMDLSLLGPELTPLDYARVFAGADAVLAMRYHSLVFALGLQVPAVAIDYTLGKGKVQALAASADVAFRSFLDVSADFLVDALGPLLAARQRRAAPDLKLESVLDTNIASLLPVSAETLV
ncbi:polysaccharide pyruvyl transferase family protein [Solimonas soli]|uniref:polysaccharide pyruvyl transferase family protein n=1 Tax=Solimonas soli TaxID=413479 RepID=UPI0004B15E20|nr:polysaccharide pyruvyl transferase family protein [Solimonas soli]